MIEYCASCRSKIHDKQCNCGYWYKKNDDEHEEFKVYEAALRAYHKHLKQNDSRFIIPSPLTLDIPEENIRALFFEGTGQELDMLKRVLLESRNGINNKD